MKACQIGDILEPFDERLGERREPEVLTLTEGRGFVSQMERFNKRLATEDTSEYKLIRRGDVAFNPYLLWAGAIAVNTTWDEAIISPAYPTFHIRPDFDRSYVKWLLGGLPIRSRYDLISFGAVPRRRRAKTADFLKIPLGALPSPGEQKRIASALDAADALRARRRESIAQLDALLRSTFLHMFGDPVTNPMGWSRMSFGELGRVVTGNTPSRTRPELYGDEIEWIKSDNISTPSFTLTEATEGLSKAGKAIARIAPAGSILITCIAGSEACIGKAAIADREVAFNQQINAFIPGEEIELWYAFGLLLVGKSLVQRASTNSMKGMVSKSAFSAIQWPCPPRHKQARFAAIADAIARQKEVSDSHRAELDALFASLQQRSFNGELFAA